ncbi:hypothetical protein TNCV_1463701 [Trichonephila clavipes]|nr:hypothetical protein TNCV_1463701 [Trichonephila clavipes]
MTSRRRSLYSIKDFGVPDTARTMGFCFVSNVRGFSLCQRYRKSALLGKEKVHQISFNVPFIRVNLSRKREEQTDRS